jgi:glutamyl-tRNA reductase
MSVLCLSVSHETAPLPVRERLAYDAAALDTALSLAGTRRTDTAWPISELAILSTCHRVELYAVAHDTSGGDEVGFDALSMFLAESRSVPRADFDSCVRRWSGAAAVAHLCAVAAGLRSVVLGESEVLGQVDRAGHAAESAGAAGPILSILFRAAVRAGRRARAETVIGRNPASIGSVAVDLAARLASDVHRRNVLVVGAGKMGARAAAALRARGEWNITVMNRSYHRAAELAEASQGQGMSVELIQEGLEWADTVISSTGAPHTIITAPMVRTAMALRPDRPLIFIDIAVPRDVDPAVRDVPGVRMFDVDHLQDRTENGMGERRAAIPRVEAIIEEEVAQFERWRRTVRVEPLVRDLRRHADAIRRREVERTLRRVPTLDDGARDQVERLSVSLMNALLHEPTRRLRESGSSEHASLLRELFGLRIED